MAKPVSSSYSLIVPDVKRLPNYLFSFTAAKITATQICVSYAGLLVVYIPEKS